ncbi:MAG: ATP-binding protein [Nanoarchaeota archaeon]|nr:ATP-binding protein [Nanoarchaeota archaeon]
MNEKAKRVVILGRSSSGKTSVVNCLRDRGYQVGHEIPTIVLDSRKTRKINLEEWEKRQKLIYTLQKTLEDSYEGLVFQDRCLMDSYAYTETLCGKIPEYFADQSTLSQRYDFIFELENLPFKKTNTRIESDEEEAQKIYALVKKFYIKQGFNSIPVPVFSARTVKESISKRADFILSKLEEMSND